MLKKITIANGRGFLPTREEVEEILKKITDCISRGTDHFIFLDKRVDEKNEATLRELGFRTKDVKDIARSLEVEDYYRGPRKNASPNVPARLRESDMWEFGKIVEGLVTMEVYIKFSFVEDGNGPFTCCVSFHKPDEGRAITYPFK